MKRPTLAVMALAWALSACSTITPGLTLKCDGHCHVLPANLHQQSAPWEPDPARMSGLTRGLNP